MTLRKQNKFGGHSMNLIICDDNPVELQRLQERLEAYEKESNKIYGLFRMNIVRSFMMI